MLILFLPTKTRNEETPTRNDCATAVGAFFMQLLGKSLVHHLLVHACYIPAKQKTRKQSQL
jgi:hypothetical protein